MVVLTSIADKKKRYISENADNKKSEWRKHWIFYTYGEIYKMEEYKSGCSLCSST